MSKSPIALPVLLIANLVASALHFGDNMLRFEHYPEPAWITGPHVVDALWLLMTPLLAVGWWLARGGMRRASIGVLWLYGGLSMFVLGHYLYASPFELPASINLLIGLEAVAAGMLLLLAPFLVPLVSQRVAAEVTHSVRSVR
jgi:hypothetical protein